ncbi:MAG: ectoine utilization protein EutA [Hyphomicrobiales bacterium]|nr:MAG: ectoine utilization protein EutA [Hyphomicrobiales bacterium]
MSPVRLSPQAVSFDEPHIVTRLGLIALATDLTSERDYARLLPRDNIALHTARVAYENPTTPENLIKMTPRLTAAADLLAPGTELAAIAYGCTAASVVIGDDAVASAINAARPGVPVVTPTGAARLAMRALGVQRLAVLAPYVIETSEPMAAYFTRHGLDIVRFECFGIEDDRDIARVGAAPILEASLGLVDDKVDGLFITCTALPALGVIGEIEARTGKPVITSNQASIWAMMRHAGLSAAIDGYGRLFAHDLPSGAGDAP